MGKRRIGELLNKAIYVGDRNLVGYNEYYATIDANNRHVTGLYSRDRSYGSESDISGFALAYGDRSKSKDVWKTGSGGEGGNASVTYESASEKLIFNNVSITVS